MWMHFYSPTRDDEAFMRQTQTSEWVRMKKKMREENILDKKNAKKYKILLHTSEKNWQESTAVLQGEYYFVCLCECICEIG